MVKMNLMLIGFVLLLSTVIMKTESMSSQQWGINSNFESDSVANTVSELGVTWARLAIAWDRVETSKGTFDWTTPDIEIQRAVTRRLKLFITLGGTPKWANAGQAPNAPPLNSQDWYDFVQAVAKRYKNQRFVKAYGMWNEPDLKEFWMGNRNDYIRLILIPGYLAVKSVNKALLVGAPEMSDQWIESSEWTLRDVMMSAEQYIDVITQHFYTKEPFADFLDKNINPYRKGKDVWITECGKVACSNKTCSEDEQSHYYLQLLLDQQARADWVKKIFPYRIWDPIDACRESGNGLGLTYGPALDKRPAFKTYRDFIKRLPFRDPDIHCHESRKTQ